MIADGQADDPFASITVIVPTPVARVQLRRAVGIRQGICNVSFRTWGEVTFDLARGADAGLHVPDPRTLDETLRQILLGSPAPYHSFAHSSVARAELVSLFSALWRSGDALVSEVRRAGVRQRVLVGILEGVESHLAAHGFTDPGQMLHIAAGAPIDPIQLGLIILWHPRPLRGRERAVLEHLARAGIDVTVVEGPAGGGAIGEVVACSDPEEEARTVCRRLIAAAETGVALWQQAIIHPPIDRYPRVLHQQLAAAGVPTSGSSPMTLAESVTGRALLGALELADGEWRRSDVVRWLESAPITRGREGSRVPTSRWDDVSARAGVVEGVNQWRTRLSRFAVIGAPRDPYVAHDEYESRAAQSLLDFVEQLSLRLVTPSGPWSVWSTWASDLLDFYLEPLQEEWPRAEFVAFRQVREVLLAFRELDRVSSSTDLFAFGQAVEAELNSQPVRDEREVATPGTEAEPPAGRLDRQGLPGPVGSGVFVGSPSEARGLHFARIYIVGLADQFLPGVGGGSQLFADAEVDDPDWPTRDRRVRELLDDVRSVLSLTGSPATVTWPVMDPRTGREHGRCRWLDPGGELTGRWVSTSVPSFSFDMASAAAAAVPVSGSDRLLGELVRCGAEGRSVWVHPAVRESVDERQHGSVPSLRRSFEAALAPITTPFSRFEGNVGAAIASDVSGDLYATRLEEYAGCPRRYLFGRQLGVNVPIRPEGNEQMEARDRGILVHEILAAYVQERINAGAPASLERLLDIAAERYALAVDEGRCGPPLMAEIERANLMGDLRRFFEEDTLTPVAAELAFGALASMQDAADDRRETKPSDGPRGGGQAVTVE
ncbi:MAG: PD-(D/E)XK nuclease family protein, partial [Acidimicrobiales bacterium]